MNCSGKFFVPIVICGAAGVVAVCFLALVLPPSSPPQPPSAIKRTASAAVHHLMRASRYCRRVFAAVVGGLGREREPERAALARLALGPDPAAVLLHDALAHRQPDAGAGVGALTVQAVERLEDLLRLRLLHPDAVVTHREPPGA